MIAVFLPDSDYDIKRNPAGFLEMTTNSTEHLPTTPGWVFSKIRWWPRAYVGQQPQWHIAGWKNSTLIVLPCHLWDTRASTSDTLHLITTLGMGGKGHLNQSLNPQGWTLSSCLALFIPQLFFWKENESSGDQDVSLPRLVFQKRWLQEIEKKPSKNKAPLQDPENN